MTVRPCYRKFLPFLPSTDLWHVGVLRRPLPEIAAGTQWPPQKDIVWLPFPGGYQFLADPFGYWHNGQLTVLAEAYDYREKRGEIHYFTYDADWQLVAQGIALQEPFHLSYPYLVEEAGERYMLPEAGRSGKLTLYRAVDFPRAWEPVATLLEKPVVDATIVRHDGQWWMFYSPAGAAAMSELHVAYSQSLFGPWTQHPQNPVRCGLDASRAGGTPFMHEGMLHLPVQDCTAGYGSGLNLLRIDRLSATEFTSSVVRRFDAEGLLEGYTDGMHTLSAAGNVTLVDVKWVRRSYSRHWVNMQRRWRRFRRASAR